MVKGVSGVMFRVFGKDGLNYDSIQIPEQPTNTGFDYLEFIALSQGLSPYHKQLHKFVKARESGEIYSGFYVADGLMVANYFSPQSIVDNYLRSKTMIFSFEGGNPQAIIQAYDRFYDVKQEKVHNHMEGLEFILRSTKSELMASMLSGRIQLTNYDR